MSVTWLKTEGEALCISNATMLSTLTDPTVRNMCYCLPHQFFGFLIFFFWAGTERVSFMKQLSSTQSDTGSSIRR
jgi:hypothetical protein